MPERRGLLLGSATGQGWGTGLLHPGRRAQGCCPRAGRGMSRQWAPLLDRSTQLPGPRMWMWTQEASWNTQAPVPSAQVTRRVPPSLTDGLGALPLLPKLVRRTPVSLGSPGVLGAAGPPVQVGKGKLRQGPRQGVQLCSPCETRKGSTSQGSRL